MLQVNIICSMSRINKPLILILLVFLVTRLVYIGVGLYARENFLDKTKPFLSWTYNHWSNIVNIFTVWDSGFYYDIAQNDYPKVVNRVDTTTIKVPKGSWVKVFLGSGQVGELKFQLPYSSWGKDINNTLVLLGTNNRVLPVNIYSAYEGIPYCVYAGPIDFERDIKPASESLVNPTSCNGRVCTESYITYYSVEQGKVLYQEVFDTENREVPRKVTGGFVRPAGFVDQQYQGFGCNKVLASEIHETPDPNYFKLTTSYNFMPLYPYLSRVLGFVTKDVVVAGLVVSNIAFVLSIIILYKLVLGFYGEKVAFYSILAFVVYPFNFIQSGFMSEGLYMLFLLACWYFGATVRFVWAGVFAGFSALTRVIGMFAFTPFIASLFSRIKKGEVLINTFITRSLALIIPTCVFVLVHLYRLKGFSGGDFFALFHARQAWYSESGDLVNAFFNYFRLINSYSIMEMAVFVFVAFACWYFLFRVKDSEGKLPGIEYQIFVAYSLIAPAMNGALTSFPRYSASFFPIYIVVGYLISRNNRYKLLLPVFFLLSCVFMALWTLSSRFVI